MGKNITVGEGHTTSIKTDHRNGKQTEVENKVEVRPVMEGYHNETVRDKYFFGRPFVTLFPEDINDLLIRGKLTFKEWKILLFLITNLQKDNLVMTNLDIIAEALSIHRTDVSRALCVLKKMNVLTEMKMSHSRGSGPVTSIFQVKVVNPNIAYNSQTKNYKSSRAAAPKVTAKDGETLLNAHAESERQETLRKKRENKRLFPEYYNDIVDEFELIKAPDSEFIDPETGEWLLSD